MRWKKQLSQSLYSEQSAFTLDSLINYHFQHKNYSNYIYYSNLKINHNQLNDDFQKFHFAIKSLKDSIEIFYQRSNIDLKTYIFNIIEVEIKEATQLYNLDKFESALHAFNKLIKRIENSDVDSSKKEKDIFHCKKYIADIYVDMGRYNEALPIYKSLVNYSKTDAFSSIYIAKLFRKFGDNLNAEKYYSNAEKSNNEPTFLRSENNINLALLEYNISNNNTEKIIELTKNLKENLKYDFYKFKLEIMLYHYNIKVNDEEKAKDILFSIELPKSSSATSSIKLNQYKSDFFLSKKEFNNAERYLQNTFDTLKSRSAEILTNKNLPLNNIDLTMESLSLGLKIKNTKIELNKTRKDILEAKNYAEEIYNFIVDSRSKVRSDLDKKFTSIQYENYYNQLIEFGYLSGDNNLLLKYLTLSNNYAISFTRLQHAFYQEKSSLDNRVKNSKLFNEIIDLEAQEKKYPDSIEIINNLVEIRNTYYEGGLIEGINKDIEKNLNKEPLISTIQKQLNKNECVVSFYTTKKFIYKLNISKENVETFKTNQPDDLFESIDCLSDRHCEYEDTVSNLSSIISDLDLKEKVTIIPHGILNCIPFETLLDSKGNKLLFNHTISYRYKWEANSSMPNYANSLTAIAPFFDKECSDFPHLANNTLESQSIKEELNIEGNLINYDISKEAFFKECSNSDILHFASHALIDNSSPNNSFLSLGENCSKDNNAAKIYTTDILKHNLSNELIVLSSCDSGKGKLIKGEGLESLAKAFFSTNVKSIISTLWSANDGSTSEIMQEFYKRLNKGDTKDVALRKAKIKFLKKHGEEYAHPFYWAGFVPFGDMAPVVKKNYLLFYLAGFILLSFLVIQKKKKFSKKAF